MNIEIKELLNEIILDVIPSKQETWKLKIKDFFEEREFVLEEEAEEVKEVEKRNKEHNINKEMDKVKIIFNTLRESIINGKFILNISKFMINCILYSYVIDPPQLSEIIIPTVRKISCTNEKNAVLELNELHSAIGRYNKQTIQISVAAGSIFHKVKTHKLKKFPNFVSKTKFSLSYAYFLISLYNLNIKYPKLSLCSISVHYINQNLKLIKKYIVKEEYGKMLK